MSDVLEITRFGGDEVMLEFLLFHHDSNGIPAIKLYHFYKKEEENDHLESNEFWLSFFGGLEGIKQIKTQILEAIKQMKENDRDNESIQTKEIVVPPKEIIKPHSLCKINQNVASSVQALPENGICQSELKQRLSTLDKDNEVLKVFKDNKCSVCLSNYKEILDEDLHIVVPSCGHPLCCKCAEVILNSERKECPLCRERITSQSFNLMKFNADLEIDRENQIVFL